MDEAVGSHERDGGTSRLNEDRCSFFSLMFFGNEFLDGAVGCLVAIGLAWLFVSSISWYVKGLEGLRLYLYSRKQLKQS
jgi:hypothetical protein